MSSNILTRVNEKHNQLMREEEEENNTASGSTAGGSSRKNNDEEDFTTLLKRYVKYKSKYDKNYKTLTTEHILSFRNEFKKQEEALLKSYNLLKTKRTKYYVDDYTVELCKREKKMKLTNTNLGKILFKYFSDLSNDKSKEEVNKYVIDIINFIEKERFKNEVVIIKCNRKTTDYSVEI